MAIIVDFSEEEKKEDHLVQRVLPPKKRRPRKKSDSIVADLQRQGSIILDSLFGGTPTRPQPLLTDDRSQRIIQGNEMAIVAADISFKDMVGEESGSCFLRRGSVAAVQSTIRGSPQWNALIKPFVSDLTFRSMTKRRSESKVCFQPYTCEGAIMFLDLSGYSKINAALAYKGAHALSSAVNEYFDRLLEIIDQYGTYQYLTIFAREAEFADSYKQMYSNIFHSNSILFQVEMLSSSQVTPFLLFGKQISGMTRNLNTT
jgi:hypothetical protein